MQPYRMNAERPYYPTRLAIEYREPPETLAHQTIDASFTARQNYRQKQREMQQARTDVVGIGLIAFCLLCFCLHFFLLR